MQRIWDDTLSAHWPASASMAALVHVVGGGERAAGLQLARCRN